MVFADGVDKMVELYVPYCKNKTASEDLVASHRTYLSVCLVMSGYVCNCLYLSGYVCICLYMSVISVYAWLCLYTCMSICLYA